MVIDSIGIGIRSTISISNTRKMIANRKNRIENGTRDVWFGSNPHSNGELFSRSFVERVERMVNINIIRSGSVMPIVRPMVDSIID